MNGSHERHVEQTIERNRALENALPVSLCSEDAGSEAQERGRHSLVFRVFKLFRNWRGAGRATQRRVFRVVGHALERVHCS